MKIEIGTKIYWPKFQHTMTVKEIKIDTFYSENKVENRDIELTVKDEQPGLTTDENRKVRLHDLLRWIEAEGGVVQNNKE